MTGIVDDARRVRLQNTVHPLALRSVDEGPLASSTKLDGLILYLKSTDTQHRAMAQFLEDVRNPGSARFRKFLTPEEYADRFGVGPADIAAIRSWVEAQGFTVSYVARGRTWIVFNGTVDQVSRAFQTEIHTYRFQGRVHYGNAGNVSVPEALSGVVIAVGGLDDFFPESQSHIVTNPEMTNRDGSHALAPDDIATIYDIAPLYQAGIDGTGQKIAIAGASSMSAADITAFRTRFNLPAKMPQSILTPGFRDPGLNADAGETALDLEWAGAVARNADVIYVYASSAFVAAAYAIDQNLAPVLSVSFGGCELLQGASIFVLFQQIAQQANAEGMTWVNASGDTGAAACDPNGYPLAQNGLAVFFPASIPEVTAVGGTQFNEQAGAGNYWSALNTANSASALSYIPEAAWNESASFGVLAAGGGGASVIYPKPGWQTGQGVPADGMRDVPDISLTAALHDGYAINFDGFPTVVAGTSASAPVFAGILALVNQYLQSVGSVQSRLGNVNPVLYQLAQNSPGVFHDVTTGGNNVPCAVGSPNCTSGTLGYMAGPGYDLATGLGSPDVFNLVHQWSAQVPKNSQVVISTNQNPVYQQQADRNGFQWKVTLTLTEEGGVPTTLTGFTINGASSLNTYFAQTSLSALGTLTATVGFTTLNVPASVVFGFTGIDASGAQWSRTLPVQFLATPVTPTITGVADAFSYDHAYAPGMFLAVFGTNLAPTSQNTAAVPLEFLLGGVVASINGLPCPLYYVSPIQVNLQIPYEILPGPATLTIANAFGSASVPLQISVAAPGIAQDGSKNLVPNASGSRGQTYTLFITGYGIVLPAVADGSTPQGLTTAPLLAVNVTVGGVTAPTQYVGIPSWAIGMVQINFQVPASVPLGSQRVVVTVGTAASSPVNFTVLQ